MISIEEIRNLAGLARLKLTSEEEASLQKDISSILEYVGQVSAANASGVRETPVVRNIMRDDTPAPVLGKREDLLKAFPRREGDYNAVRKIIEKDAGAQ